MLRALLVDLVKTSVKRVLRMAESKPKSGWETLLDQVGDGVVTCRCCHCSGFDIWLSRPLLRPRCSLM